MRTRPFRRLSRLVAALSVAVVSVTSVATPANAVPGDSNGYVWGNETNHANFVPTDIVHTGTTFVMTGGWDPNITGVVGGVRLSTDGITWT